MQKRSKWRGKRKTGIVIPNGVSLEKHENDIVVFLTEMGLDVELVPRCYKKGEKTPDAIIDGEIWEFKSPRGKGRWLIDNTIQKALRQAPNVVIDLRRTKMAERNCLAELEKQFQYRKVLKKLRVITKSRKIIDFK